MGCHSPGYCPAIKLSFHPSPGADTNDHPQAGTGARLCRLYRNEIQENKLNFAEKIRMKAYLLDTFQFNDITNRKVLAKIAVLTDKEECIKLFSHLINSQN